MPMVTVSISPEQAVKMRHAVANGSYASGSEVVRAALRLWVATVEKDQPTPAVDLSATEDHLNVADLYEAHARRQHG